MQIRECQMLRYRNFITKTRRCSSNTRKMLINAFFAGNNNACLMNPLAYLIRHYARERRCIVRTRTCGQVPKVSNGC